MILDRFHAQPISRLFLLVTVLVALLPISFLGYHLYQNAWQDSWRETREKHQLLAQNLAEPLAIYVRDHRGMLAMLAESVALADSADNTQIQQLLARTTLKTDGFATLALLDMKGTVLARSDGRQGIDVTDHLYATEQCYVMTRKIGKWTISRVKQNPLTHKPAIFMGQPVVDSQGHMQAVLLAELRIEYIEKIRSNIRFGIRGHAAIVDQTGHVIAHPNSQWMSEIKDISDWPIVQAMMAGRTGVTSFYSPFMQDNMVAGFAVEPNTGWGIMVPQPESELAAQVNSLMRSHLVWATAGLLLAIVLAILISRWITRPMNELVSASQELMHNGLVGNLPMVDKSSPQEVQQLGTVLRTLIGGLQESRDEVFKLNASLQQRVHEATQQLRESNERLADAARTDHLTNLANRRHFENCLTQALNRRSNDIEHLCVMLIDIDHFKQINDSYSHVAGDRVLSQVADILERSMRSGDLVARYGGDEFVAYMRCTREIGMQRARELREKIIDCAVPWQQKNIQITASIGLYCQQLSDNIDVNVLLARADDAMYQAKKQGRNRVVDIRH